MATVPTPTPPLPSAVNGNPSRPDADVRGSGHIRRTSTHPTGARRSRAGAAWVGICIAALLLVALIIFMLQNTQPVLVSFLGMQGSVPLAVALLIAGVGVGIIALVIGTIRIAQLRRHQHGGSSRTP
ncbi:lipopolysaccharide assembly LapA domain-containing protein [Promicromonospora sp. NPDC050880]|uniref:lipopolysaccharide assembly LapA domain-containing protein n=1 Tax=Promicromonospora sp. NPDC050880 TaxID=3364406 RepID=UPI0037909792